MIESISLANIATYGNTPEILDDLRDINYLYGSNGAGKTSISRFLDSPTSYPTCQLNWKRGNPLELLVYNNEFIEKNFNSVPELKGVFTLGTQEKETLDKISNIKNDLKNLASRSDSLNETLKGKDGRGGKIADQELVDTKFKEKCWGQKRKHDEIFQGAFQGFRGSAESFKQKIVSEKSTNTTNLESLETLTENAKKLYGETPTTEVPIRSFTTSTLDTLAISKILQKPILGKSDVNIAELIAKLNNSDWVRQGLKYFEQSHDECPFCQQHTPPDFSKSLTEYFDETFEADTAELDSVLTAYHTEVDSLIRQSQEILSTKSNFIDSETLELKFDLLFSQTSLNIQRILSKKNEPSSIINLEPIDTIGKDILTLIEAANDKVNEHNRIVRNFTTEQNKLTKQIWKYIIDVELKSDISEHETQTLALGKAIVGLNQQLLKLKTDIDTKEKELRELEKTTTSIQPTINAINSLLKSFGFKGFSLAMASTGSSYKLIRADGSDAKHTLSEGEKTFVTFLYFYHRLKGSPTTSGMTTDRVVVIDDPVSSLDSDVLFIVGSLIKKIFEEIRTKTGYIKQIFILTHNVYFHKEITFNPKRAADALTEESFWVIRKPNHLSLVKRHPTNPIKTSYELLWAEIRKPEKTSLTIQNTLRRILENYFKILGGVKIDALYEHFEGEERTQCKSLISWVNDGSHFAHDDLYIAIEEPMVDSYLKIFFKIFKATDHMPHYRMMMGDHFVDLDDAQILPEASTEVVTLVNLTQVATDQSPQTSIDTSIPF